MSVNISSGVSSPSSPVIAQVNRLTGRLQNQYNTKSVSAEVPDYAIGNGTSLWTSAPTAGLFTISGQSGAVVTTENTSDGGLRVYTATADRYIDIVMVLPNPSLVSSCALDMYANTDQNQISAYFAQDNTFSATTMITRSLVVSGAVETHRAGLRSWLWFSGTKSAVWTNTGALNLDQQAFTHFRIRISPSSGKTADATLYRAKLNPVGRSRIAVISDDGYKTWLKYAVPVFNRRGIPTAQAIIPALVDQNVNYCTTNQLRDFVAGGNECIAHGPNSGGGSNLYNSFSTDAERIADILYAKNWLVTAGLAGAQQVKCYAWPEGKYQSAGGDSGLLDLMYANGFTLARTVTRFLGFNADLIKDSKYSSLTIPIIGYVRQTTEANDTIEINDTLAAIEYCAQNGIDCVVMLHNVIAPQGTWAATVSTDITVDKLVQIADKIVSCRQLYDQQPVLLSSLAP